MNQRTLKHELLEAAEPIKNHYLTDVIKNMGHPFLEGQAINLILQASKIRGDNFSYRSNLNKAIFLLAVAKHGSNETV